jgi:nucleoside-diphosphate-sugar epimerase
MLLLMMDSRDMAALALCCSLPERKTRMSGNRHVILGTGPIGRAVMAELVRKGQPVRMVNRSGKAVELPAGVEVVAGDAYQVDSVREVTQDAGVVYNCTNAPYTDWATKFPPLQAAIVEGVAANGAKLIVADNLYMYGDVNGPIRESSPYAATSRKGKIRAQMAEALMAAHKTGKIRVAVARGSDYYGPFGVDSMMGSRAIYPALEGKAAQLTGNIDQPHSFTYIEDFGKTMVILGEREEALGEVWHVPNAAPMTQRAMMTLIFQEIGKPPKINTMGKTMMILGGLFIPVAREVVEMMYEFEKPFIVDSSKFERAFGMTATPIAEGVKRTAAWFRTHPQKKD